MLKKMNHIWPCCQLAESTKFLNIFSNLPDSNQHIILCCHEYYYYYYYYYYYTLVP